MKLLSEQQQIDILREKCDNAKARIWIASPYIGALKDVQKIIGGKWLLPSVDCRILTDVDNGFIRQDTFSEFISNNLEIRSLDSLHAKIYIVDDWCLVTSANLTGTAFLCRYEMGIASEDVKEIEKVYQRWWDMAIDVPSLPKKPQKQLLEYQDGHYFKKKFKAKPYKTGKQDKYEAKCELYHTFAKEYERVTGRNKDMVAAGFTLLQEIDYLFNYLFHDHPDIPSHNLKEVRSLSNNQRENTIKKYFKDMCDSYDADSQSWRLERTNYIKKTLSPQSIDKITKKDIREVVYCLHCMTSMPIIRAKFLNKDNNRTEDIKECWQKLLQPGKIDSSRIDYVNKKLRFFGLSSIYELIGWYYPDDYPLMNWNSDCGMRFFGYDV